MPKKKTELDLLIEEVLDEVKKVAENKKIFLGPRDIKRYEEVLSVLKGIVKQLEKRYIGKIQEALPKYEFPEESIFLLLRPRVKQSLKELSYILMMRIKAYRMLKKNVYRFYHTILQSTNRLYHNVSEAFRLTEEAFKLFIRKLLPDKYEEFSFESYFAPFILRKEKVSNELRREYYLTKGAFNYYESLLLSQMEELYRKIYRGIRYMPSVKFRKYRFSLDKTHAYFIYLPSFVYESFRGTYEKNLERLSRLTMKEEEKLMKKAEKAKESLTYKLQVVGHREYIKYQDFQMRSMVGTNLVITTNLSITDTLERRTRRIRDELIFYFFRGTPRMGKEEYRMKKETIKRWWFFINLTERFHINTYERYKNVIDRITMEVINDINELVEKSKELLYSKISEEELRILKEHQPGG